MAEWIGPEEAAELAVDGAKVALGGSHRMAPMGLVRALVRKGVTGLHLITTPTGGFGAELLAAAGALAVVETAQVSLGELGLAPAFRKGAEEGRIRILDAS